MDATSATPRDITAMEVPWVAKLGALSELALPARVAATEGVPPEIQAPPVEAPVVSMEVTEEAQTMAVGVDASEVVEPKAPIVVTEMTTEVLEEATPPPEVDSPKVEGPPVTTEAFEEAKAASDETSALPMEEDQQHESGAPEESSDVTMAVPCEVSIPQVLETQAPAESSEVTDADTAGPVVAEPSEVTNAGTSGVVETQAPAVIAESLEVTNAGATGMVETQVPLLPEQSSDTTMAAPPDVGNQGLAEGVVQAPNVVAEQGSTGTSSVVQAQESSVTKKRRGRPPSTSTPLAKRARKAAGNADSTVAKTTTVATPVKTVAAPATATPTTTVAKPVKSVANGVSNNTEIAAPATATPTTTVATPVKNVTTGVSNNTETAAPATATPQVRRKSIKIPEDVLRSARRKGWIPVLTKLLENPAVKGKSPAAVLEALKKSKGLLHPAKELLCQGAC